MYSDESEQPALYTDDGGDAADGEPSTPWRTRRSGSEDVGLVRMSPHTGAPLGRPSPPAGGRRGPTAPALQSVGEGMPLPVQAGDATDGSLSGMRCYVRLVLGRQKLTSFIKKEHANGTVNWQQVRRGTEGAEGACTVLTRGGPRPVACLSHSQRLPAPAPCSFCADVCVCHAAAAARPPAAHRALPHRIQHAARPTHQHRKRALVVGVQQAQGRPRDRAVMQPSRCPPTLAVPLPVLQVWLHDLLPPGLANNPKATRLRSVDLESVLKHQPGGRAQLRSTIVDTDMRRAMYQAEFRDVEDEAEDGGEDDEARQLVQRLQSTTDVYSRADLERKAKMTGALRGRVSQQGGRGGAGGWPGGVPSGTGQARVLKRTPCCRSLHCLMRREEFCGLGEQPAAPAGQRAARLCQRGLRPAAPRV